MSGFPEFVRSLRCLHRSLDRPTLPVVRALVIAKFLPGVPADLLGREKRLGELRTHMQAARAHPDFFVLDPEVASAIEQACSRLGIAST
jgi:hypothetical protein